MPSRRLTLLTLLVGWAVLGGVAPARADLLVPRGGKAVEGAIVKRTDAEVVFNIYNSRNPEVVNPEHLLRLPMDKVKRLEERPRPEVEIWRRIGAAADATQLAAAGDYARDNKLKAEAQVAYALALARDPEQRDALKGLGGRTRFESLRKGNPLLDPELQGLLERYAGEDDPQARTALQKTLQEHGCTAKPYELERMRRSKLQPTGLQLDRPVRYRSDLRPGAVYTLFVPSGYTPAKTWPLIVGLHGGGPDGKLLDEVVGSGPSAMNFYQQLAARHGFLVACPTALVAGWQDKANEELVRDVITELRLLYNLDVDRIYLTGHSMGGFGTWALGPRLAEDWAAISPMAGGGGTLAPLLAAHVPIFVFHGADDGVVGPASDRNQAKALLGSGHDFVYTELDKVGHGFPPSVQQELFDFFLPRHRHDKKRKDAWPHSSFEGKVSKEEALYLGDPLDELHGVVPDLKERLAAVRRGGAGALAAVDVLREQKPEGAAAGLARILGANAPFDARAYAARALGSLGGDDATAALRKAVAAPAAKDQSMVAAECARALAALQDAGALPALDHGIEAWCAYYQDKVAGDGMAYSDWVRSASVLTGLVEAWAALAAPDAKPAVLERALVQRVLEPQVQVATSARVPQDPSVQRTALAQAIGRAYARTQAPAAAWDRLLAALANDARARSAAASLRP